MSDSPDRHESDFAARRLEAAHHPAEIVFGALAFGFALFLLVQIPYQTTWKTGTALVAQPGFWPVVAILGMTLFGAAELWQAWRRNRRTDVLHRRVLPEVLDWGRALEFVLWFMAYVFIVPWLGYLPATLLFCLGLTLRLGYRGRQTLVAALLVGAATVVVFKALLSVRIPGGALYELLPAGLRNFMILYL